MEQKNEQIMDQQLQQELTQIKTLVQTVNVNVTRMETLLSGNELDKNDNGMVGLVNDIELRVRRLEKWTDRIVWIMIGMSFPAGVGTWELLKSIIAHK